MTTFNCNILSSGDHAFSFSGRRLRNLLEKGEIKFLFGFDNSNEIHTDDLLNYLTDDALFIHTQRAGTFVYWMDSNDVEISMADRRITLCFCTDDN